MVLAKENIKGVVSNSPFTTILDPSLVLAPLTTHLFFSAHVPLMFLQFKLRLPSATHDCASLRLDRLAFKTRILVHFELPLTQKGQNYIKLCHLEG